MPRIVTVSPSTYREWADAAEKERITNNSFAILKEMGPGSRVTENQYGCSVLSGLSPDHDMELPWLNDYQPLQILWMSIGYNPFLNSPYDLGIFEIVRKGAINADGSAPTYQKVEGRPCMTKRLSLGETQFNQAYTAMVDGYFKRKGTSDIEGLAEIKRDRGRRAEPHVSFQETAEVVALLKEKDQAAAGSEFLASEYGDEFYVTNAVYTDNYLDYLRGRRGIVAWHDYLEMQKCGPWYLFKWQHLDSFAKLFLASQL